MNSNWFVALLAIIVAPFLSGRLGAGEASWRAGVGKTVITPTNALWMAGYAARTNPVQGKATDLWLKALALEDASGHRAVIVTCDLVAIKQPLYQRACKVLKEKFHLEPTQFVLCASHTHCGPLQRGSSSITYPLSESQWALIDAYSDDLLTKLTQTVGRALEELDPARLAAGQGETGFAVNRRNNDEKDAESALDLGSLKGPVDHSVPVLAVIRPDGKLYAVLFGYACHNTTMDFYQWCGDYAGFAQSALERSHPEATALFFMGCGGDQNPLPRRRLELAERYGQMLASAVEETLLRQLTPLPPSLRTAMETVSLNLGPAPTPTELQQLKDDPNALVRRWAARMLDDTKAGRAQVRTYPFPVQVWQFGDRQMLVTLGGEPVVDYALQFKQEFGQQIWIAGYCNDVMTYIPSRRVLQEDRPPLRSLQWGYEGSRALMLAGFPAYRWADDVEDLITAAAGRLVAECRQP
jgi:hypothetical protein